MRETHVPIEGIRVAIQKFSPRQYFLLQVFCGERECEARGFCRMKIGLGPIFLRTGLVKKNA
jgi:hypothetical protein